MKTIIELMQLCQIHFYQKIARKKVARINAALHLTEPHPNLELNKTLKVFTIYQLST